jgi:hypothetical protein
VKYTTFLKAMDEAQRFIDAGKAYANVCHVNKAERGGESPHALEWAGAQTKEAGAVKRASLDLTRRLADMRLDR